MPDSRIVEIKEYRITTTVKVKAISAEAALQEVILALLDGGLEVQSSGVSR